MEVLRLKNDFKNWNLIVELSDEGHSYRCVLCFKGYETRLESIFSQH